LDPVPKQRGPSDAQVGLDRRLYRQNGFVLCKKFFSKEEINQVFSDARAVFERQMVRLGIIQPSDVGATFNRADFEAAMFAFFEADFQAFFNTGKQVQHLISFHRLSLLPKISSTLNALGLSFPNISTRPVLYFNHPKLAKKPIYHTVFAHQDWRSMQGSLDATVLWLPLVDVDRSLGALEIIPGSHRWGLRTTRVESGFGRVDLTQAEQQQMVPVEVEVGDALFFSAFLVHRSGTHASGRIRWSAHFRYNNLDEARFIERKFAHPYIYRPQADLITDGFPSPRQVEDAFEG
jgi:phytanoyl-CoA hydroxylase